MNRYIALVVLLVAAVAAEAPYPPSGWRPEGAQFRLPTEYVAPLLVFPPQQSVVELQFTRENIQFAGQQVSEESQPTTATTPAPRTTTTTQANEYVPPALATTTAQPNLDPLKVQGLPSDQPKDFQQRARLRQQSANQVPSNFGQRRTGVFPISGQLRAFPAAPSTFSRQQVAQPQTPVPQQPRQSVPAESYGPPEQEEQVPEEPSVTTQATDAAQDNGDGSVNEDEYEDDAGRTVVAIANGVSGQYYILSPDNTLQRVMYTASQTDDDRLVNGFSAQLKYSPVEPISDPVYGYDEQGQLVRIYKK
ncbi:uncharacterized protein LOC128268119 [Anopheles cruzii]|uniref:uncharacterized protein LOC128268119 n=1 Tax=Anopheles cruzii TaxID=68878 RepID=UPI0022EC1B28|nr:uncharacterized protein LOC128268119 [Anopheles cruzii]